MKITKLLIKGLIFTVTILFIIFALPLIILYGLLEKALEKMGGTAN